MQREIPVLVGTPFEALSRVVASTDLPSIAGELCGTFRVIVCLLVSMVTTPFRRILGDSYVLGGVGELAEVRPLHCLADGVLPEKPRPVLASAGSSCGGGA